MNGSCPNTSSKVWKDVVAATSEGTVRLYFNKYGEVPTIEEALDFERRQKIAYYSMDKDLPSLYESDKLSTLIGILNPSSSKYADEKAKRLSELSDRKKILSKRVSSLNSKMNNLSIAKMLDNLGKENSTLQVATGWIKEKGKWKYSPVKITKDITEDDIAGYVTLADVSLDSYSSMFYQLSNWAIVKTDERTKIDYVNHVLYINPSTTENINDTLDSMAHNALAHSEGANVPLDIQDIIENKKQEFAQRLSTDQSWYDLFIGTPENEYELGQKNRDIRMMKLILLNDMVNNMSEDERNALPINDNALYQLLNGPENDTSFDAGDISNSDRKAIEKELREISTEGAYNGSEYEELTKDARVIDVLKTVGGTRENVSLASLMDMSTVINENQELKNKIMSEFDISSSCEV